MKKILEGFLEVLLIVVVSAIMAMYITMNAENGFQTIPYYGIIFGGCMFLLIGGGLLAISHLLTIIQKNQKKK